MPQETEAVHGAARNRALARTLLFSAGLQVAVVLGSLVSLPFVTRNLSGSEFGVVATLTGLLALMGLADLGVGNALTYQVADALGRDRKDRVPGMVATGLAVTGLCALVVVAVGSVLAFALPWASILNTSGMTDGDVGRAVLATAGAIALAIVGSVGYRLLYALHRGGTVSAVLIAGSLLAATLTIVVAHADPEAYAIVLTMLGTPAVVATLVTTVVVVRGADGGLRPRWRAISTGSVAGMLRSSRWFWLLSVSTAVAFQMDTLIVAGFTTAALAGVYGIVLRLFGLVSQTVQPWMFQLGPALTDALVRGHVDWVRRTLWRSVAGATVSAALAGAALVLVAPPLVDAWLGPGLEPSRSLLVPAALWTVAMLAVEPFFMLLQALGRVRAHALVATAAGVANIGLSVPLAARWGASGPLWANVISAVVCAGVPGVVLASRALARIDT